MSITIACLLKRKIDLAKGGGCKLIVSKKLRAGELSRRLQDRDVARLVPAAAAGVAGGAGKLRDHADGHSLARPRRRPDHCRHAERPRAEGVNTRRLLVRGRATRALHPPLEGPWRGRVGSERLASCRDGVMLLHPT